MEDLAIWIILAAFIVGLASKSITIRFVMAGVVLLTMIVALSRGVPLHSEFTDKPLDSAPSRAIRQYKGNK